MTKIKVGGIAVGGFAAFILLSKGINMIGGCVKDICNSKKWANYYKYGKEGNMVPPGYSMHTSTDKKPNSKASSEGLGDTLGNAFVKVANEVFGNGEAAEEASEGQTEGVTEESSCPMCCKDCTVEKCPYENMKPEGGVITEWSEDGKPVAGRYPWTDGKELEWRLNKDEVDTEAAGNYIPEVKNNVFETLGAAEQFLNYVEKNEEQGISDEKIALSIGETVENYILLKKKAKEKVAEEYFKQEGDNT